MIDAPDKPKRRIAMNEKGICIRCREFFGHGDTCSWCGVACDRRVQRIRRRSKATGKRGNNSGTTSSAKKK